MAFLNLSWFKIPKRINIACMLFMACLIGYMTRVNLSINLIAMVNPTDGSTEPLPNYGPRYDWSQQQQGLLLGGYFYGYLITSFFGGTLAERFGGRLVCGIALGMSSLITVLTPMCAYWNIWALFAMRFISGMFGGPVYPCCHNLVSKWSPPEEKGKFVAALMGGTFGTVITFPICGLIIEAMGWAWAFYIIGIFCGLMTLVWFWLVADSPAQHSSISEEERTYIEKSLGDTISTNKSWPPFKSLALSPPFWSLFFLHFGSMWGLFFLITAAPKFLSEVLGFNLASAGFMSSAPHLARLCMAFVFGSLADFIRGRDWVTVTALRKIFCIPSHILPGVFLIILAFFGRTPYVCVGIMTASLGFNGAATVTNLANSQDLAPNFAGTLYGIINFFGTTPGIFSPMIVAAFTKDHNTYNEWEYIFLIGAAAYILPVFLYWLCGSGNVQKWNELKQSDEEEKKDVNNTNL